MIKSVIYLLLIVSFVLCNYTVTQYNEEGEWMRIDAAKGAPPLERPLHACSVVGSKMYVFGGRTGLTTFSNSLHSFNFDDSAWQKIAPEKTEGLADIPSLAGHTMTRLGNDLYIFGGKTGLFGQSGEFYKLDTVSETFTKVNAKNAGPSSRHGHTAIAINNDKALLIHGGNDGKNGLDDTYIFNLEDATWTKVASSGVPAEGLTSVYVRKDGADFVYVFGGTDGTTYTDKIRVYSVNDGSWSILSVPAKPRAYHSAGRIGNYIYLFGGLNSQAYLGTTSIFSIAEGSFIEKQTVGEAPSARQGHCSVAYGSKVVVWGGSKSWQVRFNDLWAIETERQVKQEQHDKKELSELIEEAIARANLLVVEDEHESVAVEQELLSTISHHESSISQLDIPTFLSRCQDITVLHRGLDASQKAVSNVTETIRSHSSDIEQKKADYEKMKKTIAQDVEEIKKNLLSLKNAEDKVATELRKTQESEGQYTDARNYASSLEKIIRDIDVIKSLEKRERELLAASKNHNRDIERLTALIDEERSTLLSSGQEEQMRLKEKEKIMEQITETTNALNEKNERLVALSKEIGILDKKISQWKDMESAASDVKNKLDNSIKAELNYSYAKQSLIESLKILEKDEELPSIETEANINEKKKKDFKIFEEMIAQSENKLINMRTKSQAALDALTEDIKHLKSTLRRLQDDYTKVDLALQSSGQKFREKESSVARHEAELSQATKMRDDIQGQLVQVQSELASEKEKHTQAKNKLEAAQAEADERFKQHQDLVSTFDKARRELSDNKVLMSDLYKKLSSHLKIAEELSNHILNRRRGLMQYKSEYDEQSQDIKKFTRDLEDKMSKLNEQWAGKVALLESQLVQCDFERDVLRARVSELEKLLSEKQESQP